MRARTLLHPELPEVFRLGLATRGNTRLCAADIHYALERGINYLNWCGHPDALSRAVAGLGPARRQVVVAVQFQARSAEAAEREFAAILQELRSECLDIATLYYVESEQEWREILEPGGVWDFLADQKRRGRLKMIGLTSHQRKLVAEWAKSGRLDLLMIRYNAAHRGAERDVFPAASQLGIPVVTFTGLRWNALTAPTPDDPPGAAPPSPVDCYRFCLAHPAVSVALTAPQSGDQLVENLKLLEDWRPPSMAEAQAICAHGDRVKRHAGLFW